MLRGDLPEIIAAATGLDMATMLFTTGRGIDDGTARQLNMAGLGQVFISLDHYLPEHHDRQRGQIGEHARALVAVRSCRAAGIYTAVQAVIDRHLASMAALEQYLEYCRGLGVDEVMLLESIPVRSAEGCAHMTDVLRENLKTIHRRAIRDYRLPKVSAMSFLESDEFLGCQAGHSFIHISAEGDVFPCDFAPLRIGNVYREEMTTVLARLGHLFSKPSCRCLAREMVESFGFRAPRPIPDKQACEWLAGRPATPPPKLFR